MKRLASMGESMVELRQSEDGALHLGYAGDMLNSASRARRSLPAYASAGFFGGFGTVRLSEGKQPRIRADMGEMRQRISPAGAVSFIVLPSHAEEATHFRGQFGAETVGRYLPNGADPVAVKNGDMGVFLARPIMGDTPSKAARRAVAGASDVIGHHGAIVRSCQDRTYESQRLDRRQAGIEHLGQAVYPFERQGRTA